MRGVARLGDLILADCGHTCKIITASPDVEANNKGVARLGDLGGDGCYECKIITASPDHETNNKGTARLGDQTIGTCYCHRKPKIVKGRIVTASSDVEVN